MPRSKTAIRKFLDAADLSRNPEALVREAHALGLAGMTALHVYKARGRVSDKRVVPSKKPRKRGGRVSPLTLHLKTLDLNLPLDTLVSMCQEAGFEAQAKHIHMARYLQRQKEEKERKFRVKAVREKQAIAILVSHFKCSSTEAEAAYKEVTDMEAYYNA